MRNIAYRRVSTSHQEYYRQLSNMQFDVEYADKLSGKDVERPELQKCLDNLQQGDTLWVHSIDRLARNVENLRDIVFDLMDKGVTVKFHKEGLEFTANADEAMKAAMSKMLLTLLGAVSEFERAIINERTREGIEQAKSRGVKFGAASESYKRNPDNPNTQRRRVAQKRDEIYREPLLNALNVMKKHNVKLTYSNIADTLKDIGVTHNDKPLTSSKVRTIMERLEISRV